MLINATVSASGSETEPVTSLTSASYGDTSLTFAAAADVGTYCTGDFFIVDSGGGVDITATSPAAAQVTDTTAGGDVYTNAWRNGMMVNPTDSSQAWDERDGSNGGYTANAGFSTGFLVDPVFLGANRGAVAGETYVKAISRTDLLPDSCRSALTRLREFHFVSAAPTLNAFPPPAFGAVKTIPATWTEDNIDTTKLPGLSLPVGWTVDWSGLAAYFTDTTWQCLFAWGNGQRNIVAELQPGPYRREIGKTIGDAIVAVCGSEFSSANATHMSVLKGLIKLGYNSLSVVDPLSSPITGEENKRWDIGRRAPVVLAKLLMPTWTYLNDRLDAVEWWQDCDDESFKVITSAIIARQDDDTEPGAMSGEEDQSRWLSARPLNFPDSEPTSAPNETYGLIAVKSSWLSSTALRAVTGAVAASGMTHQYEWMLQWNRLVLADWPRIGSKTSDYMVNDGNALSDGEMDVGRAFITDIGYTEPTKNPEQPGTQTLTPFGASFLIKRVSPVVVHGGTYTQTDIRYAPSAGGAPYTWTTVTDVALADVGDEIDADPTGTLGTSTEYLVSMRDVSSSGTGPWSRNWSYTTSGEVTDNTVSRVTTAAVAFTNVAPTINSVTVAGYDGVGAELIVDLDIDGYPLPSVTGYQWKRGTTNISTAASYTRVSADIGEALTVEVTATNSEGFDVNSGAATSTVAAVTSAYVPSAVKIVGNDGIYNEGAASQIALFPNTTNVATFTFLMGAEFSDQFVMFKGSNRSEIEFTAAGNLKVLLRSSTGVTLADVDYGPLDMTELAWYGIAVDMGEAVAADRIKCYRRAVGSPRQPEELSIVTTTTSPSGTTFQIARTSAGFALYNNYVITEAGDENGFTVADIFVEATALTLTDWFTNTGDWVDIDTLGTPWLLMGGAMTLSDWQVPTNNGSASETGWTVAGTITDVGAVD